MFLLEAMNINKQVGSRTILDFSEFRVYEGEKIGIVGANGAGKTTLLRLLSGDTKPDEGTVTRTVEINFLRQFSQQKNTLSGGEKQKKEIVELVKKNNLLVFADEPTSNLDTEGKKWLENQLSRLKTLVLISHDRDLLDALCTRIVEVKEGKLYFYTGNYSDYEKAVEQQRETQRSDYEQYVQKKRQLEKAAEQKEDKLNSMKKRQKRGQINNNSESRLGKYRFRLSLKKVEHEATILEKRAERLDEVDKVKEDPTIRIDFSMTDPPKNKRVILGKAFSFAYGDHQLFDQADFEILKGERVALCGSNGAGKTTLLHAIIAQEEGITLVPKLKIGLLSQDFSHLKKSDSVLDTVLSTNVQQRDKVFAVLAGLLFTKDDVHKKVEVLSGGELIRLSLAKLVLSDANALFLDEPTNYLDIASFKALEKTLLNYPGVIVLVSHDSRFVGRIATRKLWIENHQVVERNGEKKAVKVDTLLLVFEKDKLIAQLAGASEEEKPELEQRFAEVVRLLKQEK